MVGYRPAVPLDLPSLLAPGSTAVLTMELQRGVVGDLASIPDLADVVAERDVLAAAGRLAGAARDAGVPVVHCTAEFRRDRAGSATNAPLLAVMAKRPDHLLVGSPEAELVPELGPDARDLVVPRLSGVSPFAGTALDVTLRNLGVSTVVATGVSVNLALLGLAIEAVNLGYRVVVATDAVAGTPADYADAVLDGTLALLATRLTVDAIAAVWRG
ncbi:MAG: isochorismatase hydrolase [Acidimicrobiales bacterium]|nr:isochorismatase hydrolase [Acidimicrobiales bacterium]